MLGRIFLMLMPKMVMGIGPFGAVGIGLGVGALGGGLAALGGRGSGASLSRMAAEAQLAALGQQTSQLEAQTPIFQELSRFLQGRLGQGADPFTGQRVAGLSPDELAAQERIRALIGQQQPLTGDITGAIQTALAGQPSTQIDPEASRRFFEESIRAPQQRRFLEETLPQIQESFIGPGTFASRARGDVSQRAIENFEENLRATEASLLFADETQRRQLAESARARALQAISPAAAFSETQRQIPFQEAALLSNIGAVQRALNQAQLDFDFSEFLRTRPEANPAINTALNFLGINVQPSRFGQDFQPSTPLLTQLGGTLTGIGTGIATGGLNRALFPATPAVGGA